MSERQRFHPSDFGERPWQRLLGFALARGDEVELAVPYPFLSHEFSRSALWPSALEGLRFAVTDRHASLIRWGRLQERPTQYVRLVLVPQVASYLRTLGPLDRWSWQHGTPEDPTFYRHGDVILAAESGSGRIAVYVDAGERDDLVNAGVRLLEPLGVEAEPWPTP